MKRINKLAISFIMLFMLCGCYQYTEIENMDILTSHFVYKSADTITLGGGVANVRSLSDSIDTPVHYISAEGDSLAKAAQGLVRSADHRLFYGSIRIIIIGEQYANEGIGEFLDYLSTTPEHRTSVSIITSPAEPREIVEYNAVNDFTGGFSAENIIRTLQTQHLMISCSLSDISEARVQEQVGFLLPDMHIQNGVMSVGGYSIFDQDRKIGFLPADFSYAINFLSGKKARGQYTTISSDGGHFSVSAELKKRTVNIEENPDGILDVNVDIDVDLNVKPADSEGLTNSEIEFIKSDTSEKIKSETLQLLNIEKEKACDFLGLYKSYQKKNRRRFYNIDWREKISSMDTNVNVKISKMKVDPLM